MLNWLLAAGLAAGVAAAPQPAHAAELIILASQGSISGARDMAAAFETRERPQGDRAPGEGRDGDGERRHARRYRDR